MQRDVKRIVKAGSYFITSLIIRTYGLSGAITLRSKKARKKMSNELIRFRLCIQSSSYFDQLTFLKPT